jgi:pectinesterase inhibitor-like protein
MEARLAMSWYCGSLLAVVIALFLSVSLGVRAAGVGVDLKASCAATPHPDVCLRALQADHSIKASAATPRDLAEAALRAASTAGGAVGDYARHELDVVKDNLMWQCLNECAEDIEEALDHLDDTEGGLDDGKLRDVKQFLDTAEEDTWSCDESCKHAPNTPIKAGLLAKNRDFEAVMRVANALIKRATDAGDAPAPAPRFIN